MASELLDCGSWSDIVRSSGAMEEAILANVAAQVAAGLLYLHNDRRMIHRDLKPSNILVGRSGVAKICDFGVAAQLSSSLQKVDTFAGPVPYMSPERLMGLPYASSSDVWSLGLVMLECALGKYPYNLDLSKHKSKQARMFDVLDVIVEGPPPAIPEGVFSDDLEDFVQCCVCKRAADRLSVQDLLDHPWLVDRQRGFYGSEGHAPEGAIDMRLWAEVSNSVS
jgi:mitogen-activated protein kinase kinase 1